MTADRRRQTAVKDQRTKINAWMHDCMKKSQIPSTKSQKNNKFQ